MVSGAVEESPRATITPPPPPPPPVGTTVRQPMNPLRRLTIFWSTIFVLLIGGFVATVVILNSTVFSAGGFVSGYLHALARGDLDSVLAMPGVEADDDIDDTLLRRDALGELGDIELVSDTLTEDGTHVVAYEFTLGDATVERMTFRVRHDGSHMGLFASWAFDTSPLVEVEITPRHALEFSVNGIQVIAENGADEPSSYQMLAPGAYTIEHKSSYLEAPPTTLRLVSASNPDDFTVDVQASPAFVEAVSDELAAYLDGCAAQTVLQPTGCPFGKTISNRIDSEPEWSIVTYPSVEIEPGDTTGTWIVGPSSGRAHITVKVKSLFDGTVSQLDEDVTFTVKYLATLPSGDGELTLTPLD